MIQGKAKRKFYFGCCAVLSFINKFIPKNKKLILFFSTTNLYDNSEALFRFFKENGYQNKYRIICAVRNPKDYDKLKEKSIKFISVYTSVPSILRAKYIFYHNEMLAIRPTKSQCEVDFWHATTFKKINKSIDPDYNYDYFTYITATSELYRPIFAESFGCELERVIVNGHPRNDYLFGELNGLKMLGIEKEDYKKVMMWVPTYRLSANEVWCDTDEKFLTESGLPVFPSVDSLERLNGFLKQQNMLLLIKLHPAQNTEHFSYVDHSNIFFLSNPQLDAADVPFYTVLKDIDALITDYSSVFFDYLLLDRPIAFTVDDITSYSGHRGFVFDNPLDYMPGEKITTEQEFLSFLKDCLNGDDNFSEQRKEVNEKVNFYKDGNNCKRIADFVGLSI